MENKLVIGIPAFNAENTLKTLLASIKTQTFKDYIVVIVSDADKKELIYEQYIKELEINGTVLKLEKNVGPSCREEALKYAVNNKIPYITFIDADDIFFTPFAIEQLVKGFDVKDRPIVEVYSPFLQFAKEVNALVPMNDPSSPWVFGKMYSVQFLKEMDIHFSELRAMEDGEFNAKIRLIAPMGINVLNDPTYIWMEGSEHSITRMKVEGNDIPIYNYGLCQLGADRCFKNALDFAAKKNPLNPNLKTMAVQMLINHYFTYYEAEQNYMCFGRLNLALSKLWIDEVYKKYASDVSIDSLEEMFIQFTPNLQKLKKMPELSFRAWFDMLEKETFESITDIVNNLPKDILEAYQKTGVLETLHY